MCLVGMDSVEEVYYVDSNKKRYALQGSKSLATWFFDKKRRKRSYISLTGKVLTGHEAVQKARTDKQSLLHPSKSARAELKSAMHRFDHQLKLTVLNETWCGEDTSLQFLHNWGLPVPVLERYKKMGVTMLFQWQVECLIVKNCHVLNSYSNLIYSAPTSGGKTLVAELLMLRQIARKPVIGGVDIVPGTIFFVVPFVALAEEKATYFQEMWQDMNIGVKTFHSDDGTGMTLSSDIEIAVCTIERANILLTALLDEKREDQLKMIVIDEIHMLSDPSRGFLLEVILSKVKYLLRDKVQIVGMSATLPNIVDLAAWVDATLYTTSYRPVNLDTSVCFNRALYSLTFPSSAFPVTVTSAATAAAGGVEAAQTSLSRSTSDGSAARSGAVVASQASSLTKSTSTSSSCSSAVASVNGHALLPQPEHSNSLITADFYMSTNDTMSTDDPAAGIALGLGEESNISENSLLQMAALKTITSDTSSSNGVFNSTNIFSNIKSAASNGLASVAVPASSAAAAAAATKSAPVFEYLRPIVPCSEDKDGMKALCLETIEQNKSVMLFCNSKRRCEVCAQAVAGAIASSALRQSGAVSSLTDEAVRELRQARSLLVEELSQTQVGLCPVLRETLPQGVGYHHAGLTLDERKIIEKGFRSGAILVLCTTSTLSAGVNLPAHRVVIRSPSMGDKFINVAAFRQMCGRAGRMGYDAHGEAILMINGGNRVERELAQHLMTADLDPLVSNLHQASGGGLEKLLLELITCGRLTKESQVLDFVKCTLMHTQQPYDKVVEFSKDAVVFLKKEQFIQASSSHDLSPSPLGVATTLSGIAPKDAVQILRPLLEARRKLILRGGLHPVFLVTPPSTTIEPDWNNYEKILDTLYKEHPDARAVADLVGIQQSQLVVYAFKHPAYQYGATNSGGNSSVQLYRRFYSAILLFSLIQEWPLTRVTNLITNVTRGQLQQLQKDASTFCGMTVVFCKKLNWTILAACLEDYCGRLNYGANNDILPLMRISSDMTSSRSRHFFKNGLKSALDIVNAGVPAITQLLVELLPYYSAEALNISNLEGETVVRTSGGRESNFEACQRLARKMVASSREVVAAEVERLNNEC